MLYDAIKKLVQYGINTGITPESERIYTTNLLLDLFHEDNYEDVDCDLNNLVLEDILAELLDIAAERGIIENSIGYRDLFDTKLMNTLMPRPAQVQQTFWEKYKVSPETATDYYYKLSQDSDYIRRYRIAKDRKWTVDTKYGTLDITINLSKPEKDPKAIAAAGKAKSSSYPKCQLCVENEGYAGRLDHPARENHRIIPITIQDNPWGFQYSPYVYYNEHCIVFNGQHIPMKIDRNAFEKLFDEHFTVKGYEDVTAGIVKWPLSVIRLQSKEVKPLIDLAEHILNAWRSYTDEDAFIFAETDGTPHNTITPIARKRGDLYELDLTLRNNITTEEHPLGVYHPHAKLHHIKKENIGLIEVMGLAVLPARLKGEMELLKDYILTEKDIRSNEQIAKHADWVDEFLPNYTSITEENVEEILQQEVGKVFCEVLEDAGVYKCDEKGLEAFHRFIGVL